MVTAEDHTARLVRGTLNNCAMGVTPWGTYLTGEENFNIYFKAGANQTAGQRRYGITARTGGYHWHKFDERFDAEKHPHEANRFGCVVEIDPLDPTAIYPSSVPPWGASSTRGPSLPWRKTSGVVAYMGDDERFEYIYKFVFAHSYQPGGSKNLLDEGTLYVARFDGDDQGGVAPPGAW